VAIVTSKETQQWSDIACDVSPTPRQFHGATVIADKMYIFGGYNGTNMNDFWFFHLGNFCYD
jgi:hypothetical protein